MNNSKVLCERTKFRVLLVSISNVWRYSNVGVDQLAGYLREKGFHIDIKYYHRKETAEAIIKDIPTNYDLYGFSIHSSNYEKSRLIGEYVKEVNPKANVLFGGSFPTMYYREIMQTNDFIDYLQR